MEKYDVISVVGEGSYGLVMRCRHRESGQYVAIKKFLETEDDPTVRKMAMREIRMLKKLRHENLVNMIEVFRRKKRFFLVFEYLEHTVLEELEARTGGLGFITSRKYIYQVLRALDFIHSNDVIHRDIKPENVLVSRLGVIKLCDFGFARPFTENETFTDYVATRWYRSPELLVGDPRYGKEVDIWASGCLYSEMMTGEPLFPGESDIDQLFQIVRVLGKLNSRHQVLVTRNTMFKGMKQEQNSSLAQLFPDWNHDSLDFLTQCLKMDGNLRPDTRVLLKHDLFTRDDFLDNFIPELRMKISQETQANPLLRRLQGFGSGRKMAVVEERRNSNNNTDKTIHVFNNKKIGNEVDVKQTMNSRERIAQIGLSLLTTNPLMVSGANKALESTNQLRSHLSHDELSANMLPHRTHKGTHLKHLNISNITFREGVLGGNNGQSKLTRVLSAKPQRTGNGGGNSGEKQTTSGSHIANNFDLHIQPASPVQFQSLQPDATLTGATTNEKTSQRCSPNVINGNQASNYFGKKGVSVLGMNKGANKQSPVPLHLPVNRSNLPKRGERGLLLDVGLAPYGLTGIASTTGIDISKDISPRILQQPPPWLMTGNLKITSQGKTTQIVGKRGNGITDWKAVSTGKSTSENGNDFLLPNCPGASTSPYKGIKKKLTPMSTFSNEFTTPKFFSIIRPNKRNIKVGCGGYNNQHSGATNVLDNTPNNHNQNNNNNRNYANKATVKTTQTFVKREGHINNLKTNQPLALPHPYPGIINRSSNSK